MPEDFTVRSGAAEIIGLHAGDGPPLVLLHAGVADHRMWRDQIAALQSGFHVIAYDRREYGRTVSPDEPFTQVENLAVVLDHFGAQSVILVGCSQGGRVAIDFALAHPDRVPALVLVSTAISGAPPEPVPPGVEHLSDALDQAEEAGDLDRVNAIEAHLWLDGPLSPEGRVQGPVRELFLDMNGIALRKPEIPKEHTPPGAHERLAELTMPTLLVWADLDFAYIRSRCEYLARTLPDARMAEMPGTAHLPNMEQPERFNGLLRSFLDAVAGRVEP